MVETINIPKLIKQLKEEGDKAMLAASRELTGIVISYDAKVRVLEEVQYLKENGGHLTQEQYEQVARYFCKGFWMMPEKELDLTKTICGNCGPGGVEACVTSGNYKIAGKLVLTV